MGCCCSVDEDALRSDQNTRNPKDPLPDWPSRMMADVGGDVFAVPRDFPRMHVGVGEADGHSNCSQDNTTSHVERHIRVIRTIESIAAVIGETDVAEKIGSWRVQFLQSDSASRDVRALLDQPDSSPIVRKLMLDVPLVDETHRPNEFSHEPLVSTAPQYRASTKVFRVLEFLVQGVVFFPVQRMHFLMWFPWATRFIDLEWHCFVFTKPGFPEHVYVVHRQRSRNYCEKNAADETPIFEFEWDLVITLHSETADFIASEISLKRCHVVSPDSASRFCRSHTKLRASRESALRQRVLDMFSYTM